MKYVITSFLLFIALFACGQEVYWQQEVDFNIDVKLDVDEDVLDGFVEIQYTNHSPDNLNFIYFHLWANAYKNAETAFGHENEFFATSKVGRGWIDSLNFKVNGTAAKFILDSTHIDFGKLALKYPLKPEETISITTPFKVKIPYPWSRCGTKNGAYSISQWYPKPAVYDKDGWHPMPYVDQGEYYAEFGSFDVSISIPKDFVVAATGELKTSSEIEWLKKREEESRVVLENNGSIIDSVDEMANKTIRFRAEKVTDFAWFASRDYYVLSDKVVLESGKEVNTYLYFDDLNKKIWKDAMPYMTESVNAYSSWVGEYPYKNCSAVSGPLMAGGGMEYPMITVIGEIDKPILLKNVIIHEVGHNWFQGILASNERNAPWLDEGINSFYEQRLMNKHYTSIGAEGKVSIFGRNLDQFFSLTHFDFYELAYKYQANRSADQAINLHSHDFHQSNYGAIVYMKSHLVFRHLMDYLGEEEFDRLMQEYYNKWKFKHPHAEDLEAIFSSTNKYLDWFFIDFIQTTKKADYALMHRSKIQDTIGARIFDKITVKNYGEVKAPFTISGMRNDSIINTVWFDGFRGQMEVLFISGNYDAYRIDAKHRLMDYNRNNNTLKLKGVCKKTEPIRFQFGIKLENGEKTEISYLPIMLWNKYDETMIGLGIYNGFIFEDEFEYALMPLYGIGSNDIVGSARFAWNKRFSSTSQFKKLTIGSNFKRFSYDTFERNMLHYNKSQGFVDLKFRSKNKEVYEVLEFRSVLIGRNFVNKGSADESVRYLSDTVAELSYRYENTNKLHPKSYLVQLRSSTHYARMNAEANFRIPYLESRKGLKLRFFAGGLLNTWGNRTIQPRNNFSYKSGGFNMDDNLMDDWYLARGEDRLNRPSIMGNQLYMRDGGFKVNTSIGNTMKWMVASNIEARLPIAIPVSIFLDLATTGEMITNPVSTDVFIYDVGFAFHLGLMSIYVPVKMSETIKSSVENNYINKVSFLFDLSSVNPYKIREKYFDL